MFYLLMLLIVEVIIFCFVFTLNKQDIMSPSVIVSLVFIFSTCVTLLNVKKWNIDYSFKAFAVLSLGLFLFGVQDIIVANIFKNKKRIKNVILPIYIDQWKLFFIVIIDAVIVLLVLSEVRRIASTNTWFTNIFYAYRAMTHSSNLSSDQYMNSIVQQAMKIVIVSGFVCAFFFINNVLICKEKAKKNILYLMPPTFLCLMTLFTGVRTNILRLCVFCLICGYILLQYKRNWSIRTSWRFIRILAVTFATVIILFSVLQSVLGRIGGSTDVLSVISNYAGAPIMHFNQYIQDPPPANEVFGQETLIGVWNLLYSLGFTDKSYTAFSEYRYITATDYGNVYTIFRKFLQDFGILGMAMVTLILSTLFSFIYNRRIKNCQLTYQRYKIIIQYGYLYYIVALSSIDNIIHDYLNMGTFLLYILLQLVLWFLLKVEVHSGIIFIKKKVL